MREPREPREPRVLLEWVRVPVELPLGQVQARVELRVLERVRVPVEPRVEQPLGQVRQKERALGQELLSEWVQDRVELGQELLSG
jgi:hypothetical protein